MGNRGQRGVGESGEQGEKGAGESGESGGVGSRIEWGAGNGGE